MNYKKINDEVYYTSDPIIKVTCDVVSFLKKKALLNERKRVRLCAHSDTGDSVHEMVIVHARHNYVPPHKHLAKSESFHLIEGRLQVVIFHDDGRIREVIQMGDSASGEIFYFRLSESCFHTVIPLTDWVVFHETTKGPFLREETIYPSWAPDDDDLLNYRLYSEELAKALVSFKGIASRNNRQDHP